MKKVSLSILAVILAFTCVFGLAACGSSPEDKLKDFINSDECQEMVDSMSSSFGSMLTMDVKAEGKSLIYVCTYTTQYEDDVLDTIKSSLETAFSSMSSTFDNIKDKLVDMGIDGAEVVIRVNNADGTTIYEKAY